MTRIDLLRMQYSKLLTSDAPLDFPEGWLGIVSRYLDEVSMALSAGDLWRWYALRRVRSRYGLLEIVAEVGWPRLPADVVQRLHDARHRAEEAARTTCDVCGVQGARCGYSEVTGIVVRCPDHSEGLDT